jgi:CDP-diacylglycerol--glycerol-3-phosphate 3-phosphatidyltransferase
MGKGMLSLHVRPALGRVLTPIGAALGRAGVTADAITIGGTVGVTGAALYFYPRGRLLAGTLVITVFVLGDMLDGAVARARGSSGRWGAFLDSTLDRISDAAIFGGLLLWFAGRGENSVLAGVTLFCLISGMVVSYAKARAEGLGLGCDVGIAERTERLIVVLVATGLAGLGVPYVQAVGLWLLAGLTAVTVGQRFAEVRRQVRRLEPVVGGGRR